MKYYRVSYSVFGGNSGGYSWHTSRAAAIMAAKRDFNVDPAEYDNEFKPDNRIEVVTVTPTKAGILSALNRYAAHADNG